MSPLQRCSTPHERTAGVALDATTTGARTLHSCTSINTAIMSSAYLAGRWFSILTNP